MDGAGPYASERPIATLGAPILRRYQSLAPGPRAFIPVDPNAPVEEFERSRRAFPSFA
jgi:hypothetical protein